MRYKATYLDSEIERGLYTHGNEIVHFDSNKDYIGWYHVYNTGEIYSLPNYVNNESIKLKLKYDSDKVEFNNASNGIFNEYSNYKHISPHAPFPTQEDYDVGYIDRFFMKRRNGTGQPIIEISEDSYNNLNENPNTFYSVLHKTTKLRWKISGNKHDKFNSDGLRVDSGVYETNKRVLFDLESEFDGITNYLSNLLQYYK